MTADTPSPAWNGVPEEPERDGRHWIAFGRGKQFAPYSWDACAQCWIDEYVTISAKQFGWEYGGPALSPSDLATLRARLSAAEAALADGWQDIATAPRDGQTLRWFFEPHCEGGFMFAGVINPSGVCINNLDLRDQHPTHWRPLPTPPGATP